jgi:Serine acetyltransferase
MAFVFNTKNAVGKDVKSKASELAITFIDKIPEIKRLLCTDVKSTFDGDPAAKSYGEVIFSYPTIKALINHRVAHELLLLGIPTIPRIISEQAHSETGIDIHPAATIGEYFSIDHGTGVVIGETCIIGNHVRLYQGVTLGAKSRNLEENGISKGAPRHPVLEDNVTIYSNSTILGHIIIGHDTVVGGNVWLTNSVPPYSSILQQKAVESSFIDGLGI